MQRGVTRPQGHQVARIGVALPPAACGGIPPYRGSHRENALSAVGARVGQVYIVGKVSSRPIRPFNIASFLTRALNHPFGTVVVTCCFRAFRSRRRRRNDETASRFRRLVGGSGRCKRGSRGFRWCPSRILCSRRALNKLVLPHLRSEQTYGTY